MSELVNKNQKWKLNYTKYFDTDGFEHSTLQEARDSSLDEGDVTVIRKQIVSILSYDELDDNNKDYADSLVEYGEIDLNSDMWYFVVNARTKKLLYETPADILKEDMDFGILYTLVEEE